jgi:hypothetical protein
MVRPFQSTKASRKSPITVADVVVVDSEEKAAIEVVNAVVAVEAVLAEEESEAVVLAAMVTDVAVDVVIRI